jgi:hypothetical protein
MVAESELKMDRKPAHEDSCQAKHLSEQRQEAVVGVLAHRPRVGSELIDVGWVVEDSEQAQRPVPTTLDGSPSCAVVVCRRRRLWWWRQR